MVAWCGDKGLGSRDCATRSEFLQIGIQLKDWTHLPVLRDVEKAIDGARGTFTNFALCTPTSILPGKRGIEETKRPPFGFVPPRPRRCP